MSRNACASCSTRLDHAVPNARCARTRATSAAEPPSTQLRSSVPNAVQ
ncbi:hypothetical protein QRX50_40290 [Amycolatopsis carbonis]|uniref:Uncharacterized protein n=1 Tax=Amycolatopsis carbonis TaxID=715471 RepID=A0A9Y2IBZ0_9PSEU|nr:hypothetical protein [Amycolatopsis sp. 2-15]WIX77585.1 hypothetical protein QRX50_40290 [Amycolatopsis sp. 2-15]